MFSTQCLTHSCGSEASSSSCASCGVGRDYQCGVQCLQRISTGVSRGRGCCCGNATMHPAMTPALIEVAMCGAAARSSAGTWAPTLRAAATMQPAGRPQRVVAQIQSSPWLRAVISAQARTAVGVDPCVDGLLAAEASARLWTANGAVPALGSPHQGEQTAVV